MRFYTTAIIVALFLESCSMVRQEESDIASYDQAIAELPQPAAESRLDAETEQLVDSEQRRMMERLRLMADRFVEIRKVAAPQSGSRLETDLFQEDPSSVVECVTGFQNESDQPITAIRQFHSSMHVVRTDSGERFLKLFRFAPRDGFTSTVIPSSTSSEETRFNFAKPLAFGLEFGTAINTLTLVRDDAGAIGIKIYSGEALSLDGEQGSFHQVTYCF